MNQKQLIGAVSFSKLLSEHLETLYKSQEDIYVEWLDSLPKLKLEDSEVDTEKQVYRWVS